MLGVLCCPALCGPAVFGKQCPWACRRLLHLDHVLSARFRVYGVVGVVTACSLVEPQQSGCWQWHFHSAWTTSWSPCSLEPSWQRLTRCLRHFSTRRLQSWIGKKVKTRLRCFSQSRQWLGAALSGVPPPKMACAVRGKEQGMLSRWDQCCMHRVIFVFL